MALKSWILTDTEHDRYVPELKIDSTDLGGTASGCSVVKRTLRGGLREGVDVIEVDNGTCRFVLLPSRGLGGWRAWCGPLELGWKSPARGPVHPQFVPLGEPGGLGWLAGFDELVCRCGLDSNGGPDRDADGQLKYTLHGRIANLPAHFVELTVDDATGEIAVTAHVDEARLYHPKLQLRSTIRTRAGERGFRIEDEVVNLSGETADLELVYHINFGVPLLDEGSRVVVPATRVVPCTTRAAEGLSTWDTYGPPEAGYTEQVYFIELAGQQSTETMLRNAAADRGVSLYFDRRQLPCFTLWKSTQRVEDGYVTGLEPGINYPNVKSFEASQGRVTKLAAGKKRQFAVRIEAHLDAQSVAAAEARIANLRGAQEPEIVPAPALPWTPA